MLKAVMYLEIINSWMIHYRICDKTTICQRVNIKALHKKAQASLHLMLGLMLGTDMHDLTFDVHEQHNL